LGGNIKQNRHLYIFQLLQIHNMDENNDQYDENEEKRMLEKWFNPETRDDRDLEYFTTRYYNFIISSIFQQTGNRQLSEDLTQETFRKTFLETPREIVNLSSYLLRVSTNLVIDYYRANQANPIVQEISIPDNSPQSEMTPLELLEIKEGEDLFRYKKHTFSLKRVIEKTKLSTFQKLIFKLKLKGMKPSEISDYLGDSADRVTRELNRAKYKLVSTIKNLLP